jgi:hypothetical protein
MYLCDQRSCGAAWTAGGTTSEVSLAHVCSMEQGCLKTDNWSQSSCCKKRGDDVEEARKLTCNHMICLYLSVFSSYSLVMRANEFVISKNWFSSS